MYSSRRHSAAIALGVVIAVGLGTLIADTQPGLAVLVGGAFTLLLLAALTIIDEPLETRTARIAGLALAVVLAGAAVWLRV